MNYQLIFSRQTFLSLSDRIRIRLPHNPLLSATFPTYTHTHISGQTIEKLFSQLNAHSIHTIFYKHLIGKNRWKSAERTSRLAWGPPAPCLLLKRSGGVTIRSCQLLDDAASCCCPRGLPLPTGAGNYFTVETIFMKLVFLCHFGIWIRFWHCNWYWACLLLRSLSRSHFLSLSLSVAKSHLPPVHKTVARRDKMNSDKLPNSSSSWAQSVSPDELS